jgi:hypothetical protein
MVEVESSDTNAARVADASRRGDAPTQLAAGGLLLLQSFLDRARSFEAAGSFDGFSLFYGLSCLMDSVCSNFSVTVSFCSMTDRSRSHRCTSSAT